MLFVYSSDGFVVVVVSDTWEWEDAKGNWTEYSKPIVYLLEAAAMFGLTNVKFKEDKKELIVDLAKKVQTTKAGRAPKNVHRIKASDAGQSIFSSFGICYCMHQPLIHFNFFQRVGILGTFIFGTYNYCTV